MGLRGLVAAPSVIPASVMRYAFLKPSPAPQAEGPSNTRELLYISSTARTVAYMSI